jgi:uncharacterized protein (DUF433 family)
MNLNWDNCPEVSRHPQVMSGAAVFKNTRLPVSLLFENIAGGATVDEFVEWYPGVKKEQVEAVLKYAEESLLVTA